MKSITKQTHIQLLRGLAIIAVVLIHNTPTGLPQILIRPFLNFSVGLFLFLSGVLSSARSWKPLKRIRKVIIPYVIWTAIYCGIKDFNNFSTFPVSFLKNLITGKSAAQMYYIFIYCQFALLIPVIDKMAKSRFKYLGFIITPIEIFFMRTIPLMSNCYEINNYTEIIKSVSCLGWFTYFYLGYLMGNNLVSIKVPLKVWSYLLPISIFLQIAEGYWQYSKGIVNCGTQLKLSAIFTGVCFAIISYEFINSKKG
ncbi:MAG: acyltransferase, partial [Clostridia bacterium]|nr:acyltransferase [Clostridia bacterium]